MDDLGITQEAISILENFDCGEVPSIRLEDLSKMRKWEIMEVIGNDLDADLYAEGEFYSGHKRMTTFCKAYGIEESEIGDFYALGISNMGCEVAYNMGNDIIMVFEDRGDYSKEKILSILKDETETITKADPLALALEISSRNKGKYHLGERDEAKGFYFLYDDVKVPFRALLNENGKTHGIVGIGFGTAEDCPSRKLGLCQLPDTELCYAQSGERRATKKKNENGSKGMDSHFNGLLCSAFWDEFAVNGKLRMAFIDYLIERDIYTIRFNLKGDFRHETDVLIIYHLASWGFHMVGYTARDDLSPCLESLGSHEECILNGSNRMYTNRFKATTSLKEWLEAEHRCKGSCSNCWNCYRLRGTTITVLVHGNGSETALNTPENRQFMAKIMSVNPDRLNGTAKGLVTNINRVMRDYLKFAVDFKSTKEALEWMGVI